MSKSRTRKPAAVQIANLTEATNDMALSGTLGARPWFRHCGTNRRQQGLLQQFDEAASCTPARTKYIGQSHQPITPANHTSQSHQPITPAVLLR